MTPSDYVAVDAGISTEEIFDDETIIELVTEGSTSNTDSEDEEENPEHLTNAYNNVHASCLSLITYWETIAARDQTVIPTLLSVHHTLVELEKRRLANTT